MELTLAVGSFFIGNAPLPRPGGSRRGDQLAARRPMGLGALF